MKGNGRYNATRLYRSFEIDGTNKRLTLYDPDAGAPSAFVEIDVIERAAYYNHGDDALDGTRGYAFLQALEDAINAAVSATYTITANTPGGSELTDSGITITRSPADQFAIRWATTTIDPRLLGFTEDVTDDLPSDTNGVLDSPLSIYAVWQSPHSAMDLRDGRTKTIYESSERSPSPRRIGFSGPRTRRMSFYSVEGGHLRENGAINATVATQAGLPTGDVHNALQEFLWQGGLDDELLAVYSGPGLDVPADEYEAVRFAPASALENLIDEFDDVSGKEQASFEFRLELTSDSPVYKEP